MLMMLCSLLKNEWLNVAKLLCISAHVVGLELAGLYILLFWIGVLYSPQLFSAADIQAHN